mmetsp:Transcript_12189/g.28427  ORF Transcript_12189/g.28427 Transcript_12189/m.28427 type:complete len:118 (-) Transcript_12189:21-374(-)
MPCPLRLQRLAQAALADLGPLAHQGSVAVVVLCLMVIGMLLEEVAEAYFNPSWRTHQSICRHQGRGRVLLEKYHHHHLLPWRRLLRPLGVTAPQGHPLSQCEDGDMRPSSCSVTSSD